MMEVFLIGITTIDWNNLLVLGKGVSGRSFSRGLDDSGIKIGDVGTFVAALGEMVDEGSKPVDVLREPGALLDHAHCVVAVVATTQVTYDLMQESRLPFTCAKTINPDHQLSIVSGTLAGWRTAIINLSDRDGKDHCRLFVNKVMGFLENNGLRSMFDDYRKVKLRQTFSLEAK